MVNSLRRRTIPINKQESWELSSPSRGCNHWLVFSFLKKEKGRVTMSRHRELIARRTEETCDWWFPVPHETLNSSPASINLRAIHCLYHTSPFSFLSCAREEGRDLERRGRQRFHEWRTLTACLHFSRSLPLPLVRTLLSSFGKCVLLREGGDLMWGRKEMAARREDISAISYFLTRSHLCW